jgi:hypothetical protein
MEVLGVVFAGAVVVLGALLIRGLTGGRGNGWTARNDVAGDSSWMVMHGTGSDSGSHSTGSDGGSDCSGSDSGGSDGGGGCDGGGGGGSD